MGTESLTLRFPDSSGHMVPGSFLPMGVEVRKMVATILLLVAATEISPPTTDAAGWWQFLQHQWECRPMDLHRQWWQFPQQQWQ